MSKEKEIHHYHYIPYPVYQYPWSPVWPPYVGDIPSVRTAIADWTYRPQIVTYSTTTKGVERYDSI